MTGDLGISLSQVVGRSVVARCIFDEFVIRVDSNNPMVCNPEIGKCIEDMIIPCERSKPQVTGDARARRRLSLYFYVAWPVTKENA